MIQTDEIDQYLALLMEQIVSVHGALIDALNHATGQSILDAAEIYKMDERLNAERSFLTEVDV